MINDADTRRSRMRMSPSSDSSDGRGDLVASNTLRDKFLNARFAGTAEGRRCARGIDAREQVAAFAGASPSPIAPSSPPARSEWSPYGEVHGVDVDGDFPYQELVAYAKAHGQTALLDAQNAASAISSSART
jgi:hypothetical protein